MATRNRKKKQNKDKIPAKEEGDRGFDFDSDSNLNTKSKNEASKTRSEKKQVPKTTSQKLAGVLRIVTSIVCIVAVLARTDIVTAFGTGTGFNKAHVSPLAISSSYFLNPDSNPFSKKEYPRLNIASKKICYNLAFAGETIADYIPNLFPSTKKTAKNSKKKSRKKNDMGRSASPYSRARDWADSQNDKNMNLLLYKNTPLLVGAALFIIGSFGSLLLFNEGIMAVCGGIVLMYSGGSAHPGCQATNFAVYFGISLAVVIYINDTLMGW
eukprot:CAMPEP_0204879228 /NCGR_PEP_ID=MMETSP1349-20130617/563_1 /ASSEMBLY_ACC=CAM_ASM_000710 /TAXON_ID=215587 /ORGANISM="Aplanochytrium stocchinoi, Strain GSBS06" /LENGTH=268 /DNA_ID=CAMNT_0052036727 /DNA_START=27 /DNA_END=837 /DNA_ORIENTATION=-